MKFDILDFKLYYLNSIEYAEISMKLKKFIKNEI